MAALPAEEGRSKTPIWCFYIKGVGDYDDWVTFFLVASSIASADYCGFRNVKSRGFSEVLARTLSIINISTKLMELSRMSPSNAYINHPTDFKS